MLDQAMHYELCCTRSFLSCCSPPPPSLHRDEKITALAFAITVSLWIGGANLGVNSVAAATVGLAILLVTGEYTCFRKTKEMMDSTGLCSLLCLDVLCLSQLGCATQL
jgi:hypothetical protein